MNAPSFLTSSLLVAFGGAAGAWLRFVFGRATTAVIGSGAANAFPWATLAINLAGSFAMGLLAGRLATFAPQGEGLRLLLGVGLLGGFTTFSAFSLDIVALAQRGAIGLAALYAGISLIGGIAGLIAGLAIMRGTIA
jgi:CrcB protein